MKQKNSNEFDIKNMVANRGRNLFPFRQYRPQNILKEALAVHHKN